MLNAIFVATVLFMNDAGVVEEKRFSIPASDHSVCEEAAGRLTEYLKADRVLEFNWRCDEVLQTVSVKP